MDPIRAVFLQAPDARNTTRYRTELDAVITVLAGVKPKAAELTAARRYARALEAYRQALRREDARAQSGP